MSLDDIFVRWQRARLGEEYVDSGGQRWVSVTVPHNGDPRDDVRELSSMCSACVRVDPEMPPRRALAVAHEEHDPALAAAIVDKLREGDPDYVYPVRVLELERPGGPPAYVAIPDDIEFTPPTEPIEADPVLGELAAKIESDAAAGEVSAPDDGPREEPKKRRRKGGSK